MSHRDHDAEEKSRVRALLHPLKAAPFIHEEPSPFLKTRILARLEEQQRLKEQAGWSQSYPSWKKLLLGTGFAGLAASALALVIFLNQPASFEAVAHKPVAVKLDTQDLQSKNIARAAIQLPSGVKFYSQKHPAVHGKDSLQLALGTMPSQLPIVIEAEETGIKSVKVKFFNDENRVVAERTVKIRFQASRESSQLEADRTVI